MEKKIVELIEEIRKAAEAISLQKQLEEENLSEGELIQHVSDAWEALQKQVESFLKDLEELRGNWDEAVKNRDRGDLDDLAAERWYSNIAQKIGSAVEKINGAAEELQKKLLALGEAIWARWEELREIGKK